MVAKIVASFGAVKDSFGFNYADINSLRDLYKIVLWHKINMARADVLSYNQTLEIKI